MLRDRGWGLWERGRNVPMGSLSLSDVGMEDSKFLNVFELPSLPLDERHTVRL